MLQLKNVSKKFDHRAIAGVHALDLELKKSEILALMGPNGSGKSTLLKLISGTITPDQGEIKLKGNCHLVSLNSEFLDIDVQKFLIQKVRYEIDEDKKLQLARDLADIFEFTFQLKQNLSQLSQGQRQKILMSGELINHPEVLLLDEPFNHLDPFTRHDILDSLFRYIRNKEISVIWVTHERNEAMRLADKIAVLNFGKLEQVGSPEKVCFKPKNLFVAQFMGHKNFIPVQKVSEGLWKTPWGNYESFESHLGKEAILSIPSYAWKIDSTSNFKAKILSKSIVSLMWELEVEHDSKKYVIHLPGPLLFQEKDLPLIPDFKNCFLLPL